MAHNVLIPDLTEAISARLVAQWEAWKNQDAASNNAILPSRGSPKVPRIM